MSALLRAQQLAFERLSEAVDGLKLADAAKRLREAEALPQLPDITFAELWDRFVRAKTAENPKWERYRRRLAPTLRWFDVWPATLLGRDPWTEYREERKR